MVSVTNRIKTTKQPLGGYINPKRMAVRYWTGDGPAPIDHKIESIHASLVGSAVDYLTRLANGAQPNDAFRISLFGAERLKGKYLDDALQAIASLTPGEVDSGAVTTACRLVGYDVAFRAGATVFNPDGNTTPDATTIQHIQAMVDRSIRFFHEYGPILVDGFTMLGGYTSTVDGGDGDFLTRDTLWDFKVSVNGPTKDHTLQLLMYWLMARRSEWNWNPTWNWDHKTPEADWREVWDLDSYLRENRAWPNDLCGPIPTHLGVYNPRLDTVWSLPVASVSAEILAEVERDVIGYV